MWLKRSRLLLLLMISAIFITAPYWIHQTQMLHICSVSCTVRRLMVYLTDATELEPRLTDCLNDTLLPVFYGHRGSSLNPELSFYYYQLQRPVRAESTALSPECAAVFGPVNLLRESATSSQHDGKCFYRTYSPKDQAEVYPILHQLERNFTQRGLEIFMTGGSLLGSVRHFGFIPWDDDVDFMIRRDQKPGVRELLVELSGRDEFEFVDTELLNQHWRLGILCRADRTKPPMHQWTYGTDSQLLYPVKQCKIAVDMFFGDTLGQRYRRQEKPFEFHIDDVYPLTLRPFGPYLMKAPSNAEAFLEAEYGSDFLTRCTFVIHSERVNCDRKLLNCSQLRKMYPFVTRLRIRHLQPSEASKTSVIDADILAWKSHIHAMYIPRQ